VELASMRGCEGRTTSAWSFPRAPIPGASRRPRAARLRARERSLASGAARVGVLRAGGRVMVADRVDAEDR